MIALRYHRCMGQILIRQLDDAAIARLKLRAKERKISVEALAREVLCKAAELSVEEKLQLANSMRAKFAAAMVPGAVQTEGVDLIREDRDR
jgi:plasmid stability protein